MNDDEKKYAFLMLAMVLVVAIVGLFMVLSPTSTPDFDENSAGLATDISSLAKSKDTITADETGEVITADYDLSDAPINYLSCSDSDRGKDYENFGLVKAKTSIGKQRFQDSCDLLNKLQGLPVYITERYCGDYNKPQTTHFRCGGVCFANECQDMALVTRAQYIVGEETTLTQKTKSGQDVCADNAKDCVMMYYRTLDGQFRELSANDCDTTAENLVQELPLDDGYTTGIIVGRIFWFEDYGVEYVNHTSSNAYMINVHFPDGGQGLNGPVVDGSTYCPGNFCFEFDTGGVVAHAYYQNSQGALTADVYAVCAE